MQIQVSEKCSRCPREEVTTVSLDEAISRAKVHAHSGPKKKALVITIDGVEAVSYDFLCEECRGIVSSYCEGAKKQTKKSARRFKRVRVKAEERSNARHA